MTRYLLAAGDPVYAIELDLPLVTGLRRLAKQCSNLIVVSGDVLKTDLAALASGRRIRVYGNLPYYITSPILHHLFNFASLIDEMHFVMQAEVAQRLAALQGTRDYGYLSVLTQFYARPELVFEIPRSAFTPPPEVTSALVTLRLPGERAKLTLAGKSATTADTAAQPAPLAESQFLAFVKLCFSQKRKMLKNNLRSFAKPEEVGKALVSLNLPPGSRAEQLTVAQFAALQNLLEGS